MEIQREPFIKFSIDFSVNVIFVVAGTSHDTFFITMRIAYIILELLGSTTYVGIILYLITCTTEYVILIIGAGYGFPYSHIFPFTVIVGGSGFTLIKYVVIRAENFLEFRYFT